MINEFYADYELYLSFLDINKEDLPIKNEQIDKQSFYKLIDQKFRHLSRVYHPDFGGDMEKFQFLLKCKNILSSEDKQFSEVNIHLNEDLYDFYDADSLAGKIGNQIFELICQWDNVKGIDRPSQTGDLYEWVFLYQNGQNKAQISLNVQNISGDYAELSAETYKEDNLNVLVCLYIANNKLKVEKDSTGESILSFNDIIFIESSNASYLFDYFKDSSKIEQDFDHYCKGEFVSRQNELKTKKRSDMQKHDLKVLDYLNKIKLFSTTPDEKASDFIDEM